MIMQARLGPLIVDERDGLVAQGEERLLLNQKAVELLIRLGRAGGKPIRRESLRCELWPDREVSDKALSMLVMELRRRLQPYFAGQNPIQTVPGVGAPGVSSWRGDWSCCRTWTSPQAIPTSMLKWPRAHSGM